MSTKTRFINPATLSKPPGYTHVVEATAPARIVYILPRATGARAVHGSTVVIELEGNAEDIIALALEDTGHHRRIDATGHGDNDPGIFRPLVKIERIHVFSHRQS